MSACCYWLHCIILLSVGLAWVFNVVDVINIIRLILLHPVSSSSSSFDWYCSPTHTLETPPTLIFSLWLMLIRCGSGWLVKLLGWVGLISIQLINPKRKYEFKKNKNMKIPNIRGLMTRRLIKKYIKLNKMYIIHINIMNRFVIKHLN